MFILVLIVIEWGWWGGFLVIVIFSFIYVIVYWIWYCEFYEDECLMKEEYDYIV